MLQYLDTHHDAVDGVAGNVVSRGMESGTKLPCEILVLAFLLLFTVAANFCKHRPTQIDRAGTGPGPGVAQEEWEKGLQFLNG